LTTHVLITGAAGFIGFHLAKKLLDAGLNVIGVDGMTSYYDPRLKKSRLEILNKYPAFSFKEGMIETSGLIADLLKTHKPEFIVHLAAQAGVRYSIESPETYVSSNLIGTFEVLEAARHTPPKHLIMSSSSSVYGMNKQMPFNESQAVNSPVSLYAATKISNEVMAHSYSHLFNIPITMLRFFTVYGPWGRPDMAIFKFTKAILEGNSIDVYNNGDMKRDFTYVDDIVHGITELLPNPSTVNKTQSSAKAAFRILNIGQGKPISLMGFIEALEQACGKKAIYNFMPMQPGDVPATWADTTLLDSIIGESQRTNIEIGVTAFVDWYNDWQKCLSD